MSVDLERIKHLNTQRIETRKSGTRVFPIYEIPLYENIDYGLFSGYSYVSYHSSLFFSLLDGMSKIFTWKGLPEGILSGDMERDIISAGRVKFIKVGSKYQFVKVVPIKWDKNGNSLESSILEPFLPKLIGKRTEIFPNVEIKSTHYGESLIRRIYPFLVSIAKTYKSLDINVGMLNTKFLYFGKTGNGDSVKVQDAVNHEIFQETTLQDDMNEWMSKSDEPIKIVDDLMANKDSFVPNVGADNTTGLIQAIGKYWNELLNTLGIPSNNVEGKGERLITGEIQIQNILQNNILDNQLEIRQNAAKEINKLFGLNVSVEINIKKGEQNEDRTILQEDKGQK